MKTDLALLERLCNKIGISGSENGIRTLIKTELKEFVDEIRIDPMGNIIARKSIRSEGKPRLLLDAHMDEVGFMIVSHDGDGFYSFQKVGGIDDRILPGTKVLIGEKSIPGVISSKPVHLASASERKTPLSFDSLKIDTGGNTSIELGTRAGYATQFRATETTIFSKAIDDRIGVATLIQLAKLDFENIDLFLSFSVQEEIGLRGATVSARSVHPEVAIVVDATPAFDHPTHDDAENSFYNTRLSFGPAIYTMDSATLYDNRLIRYFSQVGDKAGLKYQYRQPGGGGTNAGAIHKSNEGIPTISISVPHRSTHSPISSARIEDWENTLEILILGIKNYDHKIIEEPRG